MSELPKVAIVTQVMPGEGVRGCVNHGGPLRITCRTWARIGQFPPGFIEGRGADRQLLLVDNMQRSDDPEEVLTQLRVRNEFKMAAPHGERSRLLPIFGAEPGVYVELDPRDVGEHAAIMEALQAEGFQEVRVEGCGHVTAAMPMPAVVADTIRGLSNKRMMEASLETKVAAGGCRHALRPRLLISEDVGQHKCPRCNEDLTALVVGHEINSVAFCCKKCGQVLALGPQGLRLVTEAQDLEQLDIVGVSTDRI